MRGVGGEKSGVNTKKAVLPEGGKTAFIILAEGTRFELVVGLLLRQFSKLVVSATHPPFLNVDAKVRIFFYSSKFFFFNSDNFFLPCFLNFSSILSKFSSAALNFRFNRRIFFSVITVKILWE